MIMSECFRLWAIESGSQRVKDILSFTRADAGAVIAADITKFRELKLRLLNGTHTFSSGLAFLGGFETVKEAMQDKTMASYIHGLMTQEIASVMSGNMISYEEACVFAGNVIDRFSNPFLDHKWISIAMNYTSKMKMRNVPLLLKHYEKHTAAPELMALGFAGYLLFMKAEAGKDNVYSGTTNGNKYPVQDPQAGQLAAYLQQSDTSKLAKTVLYNLNPADNELMATMIGNFNDGSAAGKIQWGSAWWFLDQRDGMTKQINALSNMGLLSKFIGMLTDSRSFLSYPRHEYFRRIVCDLFGDEIENGELPNDVKWVGKVIQDICFNSNRDYFNWQLEAQPVVNKPVIA